MAFSPDERTELLPNNSVPLSICPLSFKSRTSKPSSAPTQPVLSAKPLLSWSKYTVEFSLWVSTMPSPSKSNTNGDWCDSDVGFISSRDGKSQIIIKENQTGREEKTS